MTFNDELRVAMAKRSGRQLTPKSHSTSKEALHLDLGSGPRGVMPRRAETVSEFVRRRRAELTHTEHNITLPGAWR
jgi:hypothetical protein